MNLNKNENQDFQTGTGKLKKKCFPKNVIKKSFRVIIICV